MSEISEDVALDALIKSADELAPDLSLEALRRAYHISKNFQFDESRDSALKELTKLVEEFSAGDTK